MFNVLQSRMTARLSASTWNWGTRRIRPLREEGTSTKVRLVPNPSIDRTEQVRKAADLENQREKEILQKKINDQQVIIDILKARSREPASSEATHNIVVDQRATKASRLAQERMNSIQLRYDKMRRELDVRTILNCSIMRSETVE